VQGGAKLEAQGVTTSGATVTGLEVRDVESCMLLEDCKLDDFSSRPADTVQVPPPPPSAFPSTESLSLFNVYDVLHDDFTVQCDDGKIIKSFKS
jgi:hypothetical protein